MSCMLILCFALQLKLGWKTWRQLGSRKFDINLRFRSTNIFRLQLLIDPQDPVQLKVCSKLTNMHVALHAAALLYRKHSQLQSA